MEHKTHVVMAQRF